MPALFVFFSISDPKEIAFTGLVSGFAAAILFIALFSLQAILSSNGLGERCTNRLSAISWSWISWTRACWPGMALRALSFAIFSCAWNRRIWLRRALMWCRRAPAASIRPLRREVSSKFIAVCVKSASTWRHWTTGLPAFFTPMRCLLRLAK